jgi:hypothetical protein
LRAQLLVAGALAVTWIDSSAIPAGRVIAADAASLAYAFGGFEFSIVESTIEVTEDTAPVPAVAAAQTFSSWQMALIGCRCVADVSWGLRAAGRVAFINAVSW